MTIAKVEFDVRKALRSRFTGGVGEWCFIEEVASRTGGGARHADALAVNCYQSCGHLIHGVEIKRSRSDWLRELKDMSKSEALLKYCDYWWLAVSDAEICKPEELPPTWGLLIPRGDQLVAKVKAPRLEPRSVTRSFMASVLRKAFEQHAPAPAAACEKCNDSFQDGAKWKEQSLQYEIKKLNTEIESLKKSISAFETASGVDIESWNSQRSENVGRALKLLMNAQTIRHVVDRIQNERHHAAQILKRMTEIDVVLSRLPQLEGSSRGRASFVTPMLYDEIEETFDDSQLLDGGLGI